MSLILTTFCVLNLISYASDRLYLEGGNSGVTCEDVVNKKTLPHALQEELLRSRGQSEVKRGCMGLIRVVAFRRSHPT